MMVYYQHFVDISKWSTKLTFRCLFNIFGIPKDNTVAVIEQEIAIANPI